MTWKIGSKRISFFWKPSQWVLFERGRWGADGPRQSVSGRTFRMGPVFVMTTD